jgi:alpha-tubulin suppressor-like RCC1 family protein
LGDNSCGQLGIGNREDSNLPKLIELNNDVIQKISCGLKHSLLLSSDLFICLEITVMDNLEVIIRKTNQNL